jgi:hypothetical protein
MRATASVANSALASVNKSTSSRRARTTSLSTALLPRRAGQCISSTPWSWYSRTMSLVRSVDPSDATTIDNRPGQASPRLFSIFSRMTASSSWADMTRQTEGNAASSTAWRRARSRATSASTSG